MRQGIRGIYLPSGSLGGFHVWVFPEEDRGACPPGGHRRLFSPCGNYGGWGVEGKIIFTLS